MKISWNWLQKLVNLTDITPSELAKKLTLAGFEVENIINQNLSQDIILEISITANRPDINNISSIATEIAAILNVELKLYRNINLYNCNITYEQITQFNRINKYKQLNCSIVNNVSINHSPKWLQKHLISSNIQPYNNILDIVHFIKFKWGQSIKIFKISHLKKPYNIQQILSNIELDETTNHNSITQLKLSEIANYPIDIITVGHIQKQQNIKSEKSLEHAYLEILNLIKTIYHNSKNKKPQVIYIYKEKCTLNKYILCKVNNINKILGPVKKNQNIRYLSKTTIISILQRLNFKVVDSNNHLKIYIPENRQHDIKKEVDIIEEIGRIYGFNYFNDHIPISHNVGHLSYMKLITKKIRNILRSIGLHEVINYSLRSDSHKSHIINPLNQEQKSLRTNLIGSLIESRLYNTNKANEALEVFEIGKIFIEQQNSIKEYLHLAIILGNNYFHRSKWNEPPNEMSWFQAKGNIEEFFERMQVPCTWSSKPHNSDLFNNIKQYIHPQRTSYITYKEQTIGIFSQINNRIAKKLGTTYTSYIFELDLSYFKKVKTPHNLRYSYKPYSNYPKITRDISIQINKYIGIQDILNTINTIKTESDLTLESVTIFDEYYESQTTKRIGLRTTYRSQTSTLTNEKIKKIETILKSRLYKTLIKSKS